jgi:hypothetical protein
MDIEMFVAVTQLLIAVATLCLVIVAYRQLRESIKERRRSMRVRVLRFLRLYQARIEGAIAKIPKNEFNSWDIKNDILGRYTEEFYSLRRDVRLKLLEVILKYQTTKAEKKPPGTMKNSLEDLRLIIEKEIDKLTSKLDLDRL